MILNEDWEVAVMTDESNVVGFYCVRVCVCVCVCLCDSFSL